MTSVVTSKRICGIHNYSFCQIPKGELHEFHSDGNRVWEKDDYYKKEVEMSKIKKPYAAINALTGVEIKRFKTAEKLAKFLFKKKKTALGVMSHWDFLVRPYLITEETDKETTIAPIEFV